MTSTIIISSLLGMIILTIFVYAFSHQGIEDSTSNQNSTIKKDPDLKDSSTKNQTVNKKSQAEEKKDSKTEAYIPVEDDTGSLNNPDYIEIENAKIIYLSPIGLETKKLDLGEEQDWGKYWEIYNKAFSYLETYKWYNKAKKEFLKIFHWTHSSNAYNTNLLITYRLFIKQLISKNKYLRAYQEIQEMFDKCQNTNDEDIANYNLIIDKLHLQNPNATQQKMKTPTATTIKEYAITSDKIRYLASLKKKQDLPNLPVFITQILKHSKFLPQHLPFLIFDGRDLKIETPEYFSNFEQPTFITKEATNHSGYITCSNDLNLYVLDPDLHQIITKDINPFTTATKKVKSVDLSADLNLFLFTSGNKVFLLDRSMIMQIYRQIPSIKQVDSDSQLAYHKTLLGITDQSSKEQLQEAFRSKFIEAYFDFESQKSPFTESKLRQLIKAYTTLTKEPADKAFSGDPEEKIWKDNINNIVNVKQLTESGLSAQKSSDVIDDWIQCSFITPDAYNIYLGCYSGYVYRINQNCVADTIFIVQTHGVESRHKPDPIIAVVDRRDYLHILTTDILYILENDQLIHDIPVKHVHLKWFDNGFIIHHPQNELNFYNNAGELIETLKFQDSIKHLAFRNGTVFIETTSTFYAFVLSI